MGQVICEGISRQGEGGDLAEVQGGDFGDQENINKLIRQMN
jgi:hypothetical protein